VKLKCTYLCYTIGNVINKCYTEALEVFCYYYTTPSYNIFSLHFKVFNRGWWGACPSTKICGTSDGRFEFSTKTWRFDFI